MKKTMAIDRGDCYDRMIPTPGTKERLLKKLRYIILVIEDGAGRDTISFHVADLMPMVSNAFGYYPRPKKKTRK